MALRKRCVLRTDVKASCESIDPHLLLEILAQHINDRGVVESVVAVAHERNILTRFSSTLMDNYPVR